METIAFQHLVATAFHLDAAPDHRQSSDHPNFTQVVLARLIDFEGIGSCN
jgi:hypothetical protein